MTEPQQIWADDIFDAFMALDIRQVGYVPDSGHSRLIVACHAEPRMRAVPLTTEEEGIGLLAGAWLGGQRGAILMQSSGVGNCVNALSILQTCRLPMLAVVTMRGQWAETNPWQVPMGRNAGPVLEQMGVMVYDIDQPDEVGAVVEAAGRMAFFGPAAAAVLISQRLIGAKAFGGEK